MPRRICIFCGSDSVKITHEHVWPDWMSNVLGNDPKTTFSLKMDDIHRVRTGTLFSQTVRQVCKPCNEGWMSKLEKASQPFLTPMIEGRSGLFGSDVALLVATWFTKTVLVCDLMVPERAFPDTAYREFYQHQEPFPYSALWLTSLVPGYASLSSFRSAHDTGLIVNGQLSGERHKTYICTIKMGQLIGQLVISGSADIIAFIAGHESSDGHSLAWPYMDVVQWPLTRFNTMDGIEAFAFRRPFS
jgi:hypothetical protein